MPKKEYHLIAFPHQPSELLKLEVFTSQMIDGWPIAYNPGTKKFYRLLRFSSKANAFAGEFVCSDSTTVTVEISVVFILWAAFFSASSGGLVANSAVDEKTLWAGWDPLLVKHIYETEEFNLLLGRLVKIVSLGDVRLLKFCQSDFESKLAEKVQKLRSAIVDSVTICDTANESKEQEALVKSLEALREFLPSAYFFDFAQKAFNCSKQLFNPAAVNKRLMRQHFEHQIKKKYREEPGPATRKLNSLGKLPPKGNTLDSFFTKK